jgi:tetratricopeptide (TPR) repeat protein
VGYALAIIGDPREGLRHARRAVEARQASPWGHFALGVEALTLNLIDEASSSLKAVMQCQPGFFLEYIVLAWQENLCLRAGDWPAALAAWDRGFDLNPSSSFGPVLTALVKGHMGEAADSRARMANGRRIEPAITLAVWEWRLRNWHRNSPALEELLARLRDLWAETEPGR